MLFGDSDTFFHVKIIHLEDLDYSDSRRVL